MTSTTEYDVFTTSNDGVLNSYCLNVKTRRRPNVDMHRVFDVFFCPQGNIISEFTEILIYDNCLVFSYIFSSLQFDSVCLRFNCANENTCYHTIAYCSIINLLWSLKSKMSTTFRSVSYGPCSRTGVMCVASDFGRII